MLEEKLKIYREQINNRLKELLAEQGNTYDILNESAHYAVSNGGKRLRPIMLMEFYKICGGKDDNALDFACALEMIHSYSLVHDDLPCMDDDDFRRGKPSCHKKYGVSMALLAGDALLTEAFKTAANVKGIPADRVVRAISFLASNAGINGMVGGQVLDTEELGLDKNEKFFTEVYLLKTGALLKAACVCGAILGGADDEKIKLVSTYAEKMGFAFQVIDDILDIIGDEKLLGKPIGSDEKNGKVTLVSLMGIEKGREIAAKLTDESLCALSSLDGDTEMIKELTDYLLKRNY